MSKQTIREQLERIKKLHLKLDKKTGMLWSNKRQFKAKYKKITLYAIFVSDEHTIMLRPHVFETKQNSKGRTPAQWRTWLGKNYNAKPDNGDGRPGVLYAILRGMTDRTGGNKFWRLLKLIGWLPRVYLLTGNSGARNARNKTKRTGRKNGHTHIRRRQRNVARKTNDTATVQRTGKRKRAAVRKRKQRNR